MHKENTQGDIDILDLTNIEKKVLRVLLSGSAYSVAQIGRKSKVGYTSVKSVLIRLRERGLVQKRMVGKRFTWKISGRKKINREISEVLSYTHAGETISTPEDQMIDFSDTLRIEFFSGLDAMVKVIQNILLLHKTERILGIEGKHSATAVFKKIPTAVVASFNETMQKHQIITEGIISEGVLKELQSFRKRDPLWEEHFFHRAFDLRVVSNPILDNLKGTLTIYRDIVLITDWDKETLICIRNKETVALLTIMFRALQETGKKIHVPEAVRGKN